MCRPIAWVRVSVAPTVPSPAGPEKPASSAEHTIQAEPTFFVKGFFCTSACPADRENGLRASQPRQGLRICGRRPGRRCHQFVQAGSRSQGEARAAEARVSAGRKPVVLARGRRLRPQPRPARLPSASRRRCSPSTARRLAIPGPAPSRTGTNARSPASATDMASGNTRAGSSCRSTRETSGPSRSGRSASRCPT